MYFFAATKQKSLHQELITLYIEGKTRYKRRKIILSYSVSLNPHFLTSISTFAPSPKFAPLSIVYLCTYKMGNTKKTIGIFPPTDIHTDWLFGIIIKEENLLKWRAVELPYSWNPCDLCSPPTLSAFVCYIQ